jgi:hypothetical protein
MPAFMCLAPLGTNLPQYSVDVSMVGKTNTQAVGSFVKKSGEGYINKGRLHGRVF